ncbi:MAG: MgtC/SapB family protein [Phycisphaerae bacterium]
MLVDWHDIVGLLLACFAGGVIGLERELNDKPAGLRTNIFICFGAALFTIMSSHMADAEDADKTRIAAQIVTGVGFLGAGSIIQAGRGVRGLTTAATIWTNASIGLAFGAGYFALGGVATGLALTVLLGFNYFERWLEKYFETSRLEIEIEPNLAFAKELRDRFSAEKLKRRRFRIEKANGNLKIQVMFAGPATEIENLTQTLLTDERILTVHYIG